MKARTLAAALTLIFCLSASARATDHYCTTSSQLTTALANAVGGDTITLQAGNTFVGPFTLRSGLTSTVTVRSSAHASIPGADVRVSNSDRANMPIIHCGNSINENCFITSGTDADNWRLTGLEIRPKPAVTVSQLIQLGTASDSVVANTPDNIEIDHCYIHAPEAGSVRGIYIGGRNINVHDNYITGFRKHGQECQAVLLAAAPGPITIRNNYLSGIGEVVMTGGVGVPSATMPGNLTMTRNYLEAPQKYNPWNSSAFDDTDAPWSTALSCSVTSSGTAVTCNGHGLDVNTGWDLYVIKLTSGPQAGQKRTVFGVPTANTMTLTEAFSANQVGASATIYGYYPHKNNFELKMLTGTTNLIEGNVFDGSWPAGQVGFGLVFTIRAQESSGSPHAVIKNVTFRYNYIKRVFSGVSFLTSDYLLPTDHMQNFTVSHNLFEGLGSAVYGAGGQLRTDAVQIGNGGAHGADDLTVSHNTFVHAQTTPQWGTAVLFTGDDSSTTYRHNNLVIKDNMISFETNGIRTEGGQSGTNALAGSTNSYTYLNNVLYRAPSTSPSGYPTTSNWYETSSSPLGWNNAANADYSLSSGDYRAGQSRQASDLTNVGADISTLSSKIGAGSNAYATATISAATGVWGQTPFGGTPIAVPGTIPASDFDNGGEGVAYHDLTSGNIGSTTYRASDVDMNDQSVTRLEDGEWLEYTINVGSTASTYAIVAQVAHQSTGGSFHVEIDGTDVTGAMTVPDTTYWNSWNSAVKTGVSLTAGQHVLRFGVDGDFYGFQSLRIVNTAATQSPYGGSAHSLPGTVSALDFDNGGEQVAYHDNTAGCEGDCSYRNTDVDMWSSVPTVYRISSGEWMEYTVNVTSAGTYKLTVQAASDTGGGTFHVEMDGVDVTGTMTFPNTGGWSTFQAVTKTGISLTSGQKVMRVVIDSSNSPASTNLGSIKSIKVEP
ncbi:MAG: carbohydrate-binding protein [Pyrinomonadaceae bacterium]